MESKTAWKVYQKAKNQAKRTDEKKLVSEHGLSTRKIKTGNRRMG